VLHDGDLALYLERGGRSMLTFTPFDDDAVASLAIEALGNLLADDRLRRLQVERIDGLPIESSPHRPRLEALGFRRGYRGLVLGPGSGTPGPGAGLRAGA
jgi:ATP-dependent Lhr-like helicase